MHFKSWYGFTSHDLFTWLMGHRLTQAWRWAANHSLVWWEHFFLCLQVPNYRSHFKKFQTCFSKIFSLSWFYKAWLSKPNSKTEGNTGSTVTRHNTLWSSTSFFLIRAFELIINFFWIFIKTCIHALFFTIKLTAFSDRDGIWTWLGVV